MKTPVVIALVLGAFCAGLAISQAQAAKPAVKPAVTAAPEPMDGTFVFRGDRPAGVKVSAFTDRTSLCDYIIVQSPQGVAVTPRLSEPSIAVTAATYRGPRCQ